MVAVGTFMYLCDAIGNNVGKASLFIVDVVKHNRTVSPKEGLLNRYIKVKFDVLIQIGSGDSIEYLQAGYGGWLYGSYPSFGHDELALSVHSELGDSPVGDL